MPWIAVTGANPTYTITALPVLESLIGSTLSYKLKITFADAKYPNPVKRMDLDTTISAATCDCDLLDWDAPTKLTVTVDVALGPETVNLPTMTMNDDSKLPTPEIRKCFAAGGNNCANSITYAATITAPADKVGALPGFIVQTGTTEELVITPVAAGDMGTWTISVTPTVTYTAFSTTTF